MKQLNSQTDAFSSGSNLWIIADLESSKWAQKLDWYLNFQLRRAKLHTPKKISESAQEKIASWGIDVQKLTKGVRSLDRKKAALMIASQKLLPHQLTIQIPFRDLTVGEWAQNCLKLLQNLKQTQARIFLPQKISASEFSKVLGSKNSEFEIEMIEEALLD